MMRIRKYTQGNEGRNVEPDYLVNIGHATVSDLIKDRMNNAAFRNPGPMRPVTIRIPVETEAQLVYLARSLDIPRSTLLRDIMQAAMNEAVEKVLSVPSHDGEDHRPFVLGEIDNIRRELLGGDRGGE